jgi:hypothetical protein
MGSVEQHVLSNRELTEFGAKSDWLSRLRALSLHQRQHWPMLAAGHATLATAQVRRFPFDGFEIRTQFNPGRMASAAAKIDPGSLKDRRCFLCPQNLPADQKGLRYRDYLVLCNPFPILDEHFTISHVAHRPQHIHDTFDVFIELTRDLGERYTVLYNGPRAGASAPDHLHFQAGTRGWMPIDNEYEQIRQMCGILLADRAGVSVWSVTDYLRPILALESSNPEAIRQAFDSICEAMKAFCADHEEPMMNLLGWCDQGRCTVIVFPRARHRPSCFFEEGQGRILVSPGAVDVGGVLITPLGESFDRLNHETIRQILTEVSISSADFERLKASLSR